MANISHMDEIIDYKASIISEIKSSQKVMGLIANDPNIDLNDDKVEDWEKHIYDYNFVSDTLETAGAYITVEVEMIRQHNSTKDLAIYIQVICAREYMDLQSTIFKGMRGNRVDNLTRYIDLLINGSRLFGIGELEPYSNKIFKVSDQYVTRVLTYNIPNFAKNRKLERK